MKPFFAIAAGLALLATPALAQDFDALQSQFMWYRNNADTDIANLRTNAQAGNVTAACADYTSAWSDLGHAADVLEEVRDAINNGATPNAFFAGTSYSEFTDMIDDLREQQQRANDDFEENCSN